MTDTAPHATRRSALTIAAEVAVLLMVAAVLARLGHDALKPPPPPPPLPKVGGMIWTSYANNNAAHFGFTNLTTDTRVACTKGVVTATQSRISIESVVVCTGEVKPNTTVNLDATWPKGSPDDICNKEGSFGKVLDWSKCEFTHQEVPPALTVSPALSNPGAVAAASALAPASADHP